jgi:hypothetical protein
MLIIFASPYLIDFFVGLTTFYFYYLILKYEEQHKVNKKNIIKN